MSEDPHSSSPGPPDMPVAGSFESLQLKALDLLKNPLVAAGGALVVGLLIARMTGENKMRQSVLATLTGLLKDRQIPPNYFTPTDPQPQEEHVEDAAPQEPKYEELGQLGRKLLAAVAPQIEQFAKKKLEEFFPSKQ